VYQVVYQTGSNVTPTPVLRRLIIAVVMPLDSNGGLATILMIFG
jgi:hypothetical protein